MSGAKQSTAIEMNSTFYAMRLLTHNINLAAIQVSVGNEYPATEFTTEEQARGLEIIREIRTHDPYLLEYENLLKHIIEELSNRIDELATSELVAAGYVTSVTPDSPDLLDDRTDIATRTPHL